VLSGAHVEVIHPLEHFVERLGDDGIHRPSRALQPGKVLVEGRRGLQSFSWRPRFVGSGTKLLATLPDTRKIGYHGSPPDRLSAESQCRCL
jgi:hypothetical protein